MRVGKKRNLFAAIAQSGKLTFVPSAGIMLFGGTMTRLTKQVSRFTDAMVRDRGRLRNIVVTLFPNDTLGLRLAKTRKTEIVTLESIYSLAVKQRVALERAEKRKARTEKLKLRGRQR